jgi:hypothetical protein
MALFFLQIGYSETEKVFTHFTNFYKFYKFLQILQILQMFTNVYKFLQIGYSETEKILHCQYYHLKLVPNV